MYIKKAGIIRNFRVLPSEHYLVYTNLPEQFFVPCGYVIQIHVWQGDEYGHESFSVRHDAQMRH